MQFKEKFREGMKGTLSIKVVNKKGVEIDTFEWNNLITTNGYIAASECLAGSQYAYITNVSFGTDTTTPSVNDSSITNAVTVPITDITYPEAGTASFHFLVDWLDAVGMDIYEWGLITVDGRLFSRVTRDVISKTEEMQLLGEWKIKM